MRKLANEELHRLSVAAYKDSEKIPVIVILDNVRSLNNIGSVFRTADAFAIEKSIFVASRLVLLTKTYTRPPWELPRVSLGNMLPIFVPYWLSYKSNRSKPLL